MIGKIACANHTFLIKERIWYDEHLFRDGAMIPEKIGLLIKHLEKLDFKTMYLKSDGGKICIVESFIMMDYSSMRMAHL